MNDEINKWTGRPKKPERRIRPGQYAREAPPEPRPPMHINLNLTQRLTPILGLKPGQLESIIDGFEQGMPISDLEAELEMPAMYIARKIEQISRYFELRWENDPAIMQKVQDYLIEAKEEEQLVEGLHRNNEYIRNKMRQVANSIPEIGYEIGVPLICYENMGGVSLITSVTQQYFNSSQKAKYPLGIADELVIPILDTDIEMPFVVEDFKGMIEAETSKVEDYRTRISFGYEGNSVVLSATGSRRDKIIGGIFLEAYIEVLEAPTQEMRELANQIKTDYKIRRPYYTERGIISADYAGTLVVPLQRTQLKRVEIRVAADQLQAAVEEVAGNIPDIKIVFYHSPTSIMMDASNITTKQFLIAYGGVLEHQRLTK